MTTSTLEHRGTGLNAVTEYDVRALLIEGLHELAEDDKAINECVQRHDGLRGGTQDAWNKEMRQLARELLDPTSPHYVRVSIGYPTDQAHLPAIGIILDTANEDPSGALVGDDIHQHVSIQGAEPDLSVGAVVLDGRRYFPLPDPNGGIDYPSLDTPRRAVLHDELGTDYRSVIEVSCWAVAPEVSLLLQAMVRWALWKKKGTLQRSGSYDVSFDEGGAQQDERMEPRVGYVPIIRLGISWTYKQTDRERAVLAEGGIQINSTPFSTTVEAPVVLTAPANATPPWISGTRGDGLTITGSLGRWTGTAPIELAVAWELYLLGTWTVVSTAYSWTDGPTTIESDIRWTVTGTGPGGGPVSASSQPICGVTTGVTVPPVIDGVPTVSGTIAVGYTVTITLAPLSAGTEPITQTIQVYADAVAVGAPIAAPTGTVEYAIDAAQVGTVLTFEQMAANGGGADTATSAPTAAVGAAVAPVSVLPPQISGARGGTLTYLAGTYTGSEPITATHVWQTSPYEAGTWTTVGSGATYDDPATSDLDLRIFETPTGPGGPGTPVASRTTPGRLTTGPIRLSDLTFLRESDPNATRASGAAGSRAGTVAAGAAQTITDGICIMWEVPRDVSGSPWDYGRILRNFSAEVILTTTGVLGDDIGIAVGLGWSTSGTGAGGLPLTAAEIDEVLAAVIAGGGDGGATLDPGAVLVAWAAYFDSSGSPVANHKSTLFTCFTSDIDPALLTQEIGRWQAITRDSDGKNVNGSEATSIAPGVIGGAGQRHVLFAQIWRRSTVAAPQAFDFDGLVSPLQFSASAP